MRFVIGFVLGSTDGDSVTRRLRVSIARARTRSRLQRKPPPFPDLLDLLTGRPRSEAIIRQLNARRRR